MVESQPSKLLVAGSIPVSRSKELSAIELSSTRAFAVWFLSFDLLDASWADVAQLVEHVLGKDGVSGSIPLIGSRV